MTFYDIIPTSFEYIICYRLVLFAWLSSIKFALPISPPNPYLYSWIKVFQRARQMEKSQEMRFINSFKPFPRRETGRVLEFLYIRVFGSMM